MQKGRLGKSNLEVSAIGLGCMGKSFSYGPPKDKGAMSALLRAAVDRGITFFYTAEVYGPFTNEEFLGVALASFRKQVVLALKFGLVSSNVDAPGMKGSPGLNSRPEHIKQATESFLKRLEVENAQRQIAVIGCSLSHCVLFLFQFQVVKRDPIKTVF